MVEVYPQFGQHLTFTPGVFVTTTPFFESTQLWLIPGVKVGNGNPANAKLSSTTLPFTFHNADNSFFFPATGETLYRFLFEFNFTGFQRKQGIIPADTNTIPSLIFLTLLSNNNATGGNFLITKNLDS
jgi:hypothetical protein